jgi:quinol monooxygenase YgiN
MEFSTRDSIALKTPVDVPVVAACKFQIKPEKRDLFLEIATSIIEPSRKELGVISYSFYEESTVPNSFLYFEEWQSREALSQHLKTDYTQKLMNLFPEMIDREPNIRVYDVASLTYELPD